MKIPNIEIKANRPSGNRYSVHKIYYLDDQFIAYLPYFEERQIFTEFIITQELFDEIKRHWEKDESVLLHPIGTNIIQNDNKSKSTSYSIEIETDESLFLN